jgi:hypothetical protein
MAQLKVEHKHRSDSASPLGEVRDYKFRQAIIPPTWTKSEYYLPMKNVWKKAAIELSEAENIYIIGYSLPETDAFFPYLYSLSTLDATTQIDRFWVFNLDGTNAIQDRYKRMVGKGIEKKYHFYNEDFLRAIDTILPHRVT